MADGHQPFTEPRLTVKVWRTLIAENPLDHLTWMSCSRESFVWPLTHARQHGLTSKGRHLILHSRNKLN